MNKSVECRICVVYNICVEVRKHIYFIIKQGMIKVKNKKTLALFLCAIMIATTFCSAPLSVSAEENENIYSQTIATEMATEGATESVSEESTLAELTDTVNQNTAEVATEPYSDIDTYTFSKSQKTLKNESSATEKAVTFSNSPIVLGVGEAYTFSGDLLQKTLATTAKSTYKWSSNNTAVLTVNSSGKITAKKAGEATINVVASNGKKATCKVTVKNAPTKVTLNKTAVTLGVGETFDLNPTLPSGTASYSIKFTSNSTGVATVKLQVDL